MAGGDQVARLSATAADGTVVIDEFFLPIGEVADSRTAVSAITAEILAGRAIRLSSAAIECISAVADAHTIIIWSLARE
jgi:hypothetical protein